jgi:uncharacterized protein
MDEKALKERLAGENPDFRAVFEEHSRLEKALDELKAKSFLTEEESFREKEFKKRKLVLKDKMYRMMSEYGKSR